jgi:hypothetical protein
MYVTTCYTPLRHRGEEKSKILEVCNSIFERILIFLVWKQEFEKKLENIDLMEKLLSDKMKVFDCVFERDSNFQVHVLFFRPKCHY